MNRALRSALAVAGAALLSITAANAQSVSWKLHMNEQADSELNAAAQRYIVDEIAERTNGDFEIVIFPSGQLGGERDVFQGLQLGTVEASTHTGGILGNYVPGFAFAGLPLMFDGRDHFNRYKGTDAAKELFGATQGSNFILTSLDYLGERLPNSREILFKTPEDFNGVRLRTMEVKAQVDTINALGGIGTPMPYSDVYGALQTGTVDAWMADALAFRVKTSWEVAPYVTLLPLFASTYGTSISKPAFDKLSPEYQEIVLDVFQTAGPLITAVAYDDNLAVLNHLIENEFAGHHVVEDTGPFRALVKPLYDEFVAANPSAQAQLDAVDSVR